MKPNPDANVASSASPAVAPALFGFAAFLSASLVFMVEPMVAKLILPLLGGSAAVWAVSLAFFQLALLIGYGYAHALQRIASVRVQTLLHGAVLLAGLAVLPLHVTGLLGDPSSSQPALWLLGVLTVSIGLPFAALSATAPLIQAWYASARAAWGGGNPYGLYVASNLGSLLALLAYPVAIEPFVRVSRQTLGWSAGYAGFILVMVIVAAAVWRAGAGRIEILPVKPPANRLAALARWWRRLLWVALAAAPASLMLGVTTYIATDIASAPFLWVAPLALYLLTFVIAFQTHPVIPQSLALVLQTAALLAALVSWGMPIPYFWLQIGLQLVSFFLTALVCHQALAIRRPPPERLTEFYLLMSLGGVIGGAFNAFLAPVIFNSVIEYPLVMLAAGLARPWGKGWLSLPQTAIWILGVLGAAGAIAANHWLGAGLVMKLMFVLPLVAAFLLRDRAVAFVSMALAMVLATQVVAPNLNVIESDRSFFGVVRLTFRDVKGLGRAKLMAHGTTLHGAQAQNPDIACRPLVYYAPTTPIGQVFRWVQSQHQTVSIGAVGMGAGTVATYTRPGDALRFFEIDPLVVRLSTDPKNFSYIKGCAKGQVDWVLGDARLTLARQPAGGFDILLVDAFSSDSVPAHLLTVEAMKGYLQKIKPDGVVIMHLSNRNLELTQPVGAVAKAAGATALRQFYRPPPGSMDLNDSAEDVVLIARDPAALKAFTIDPRWKPADPKGVEPWTDDYTDLLGALIRGVDHNARETKISADEAAEAAKAKPAS
ncbi:fused MFS/spermidine synthase [Phenylobacterium montanum]|uniref:Fused MFS/spermidine synthase n=1 Tax=Phenylobacterium montanum TaxID=2823693 RepID=A0A975IVT0_9CAUL|nr:fused MFS/spermidine synthase [Caulobacter sp. S6]QUD88874.1 fused MFS/spermidine synthase [Caulobacter sp. S6]